MRWVTHAPGCRCDVGGLGCSTRGEDAVEGRREEEDKNELEIEYRNDVLISMALPCARTVTNGRMSAAEKTVTALTLARPCTTATLDTHDIDELERPAFACSVCHCADEVCVLGGLVGGLQRGDSAGFEQNRRAQGRDHEGSDGGDCLRGGRARGGAAAAAAGRASASWMT